MLDIFISWNLEELYPTLKAHDIDNLDTLGEFILNCSEDLKKEIIPSIGLRLRLQSKYKEYVKNNPQTHTSTQLSINTLKEVDLPIIGVPIEDFDTLITIDSEIQVNNHETTETQLIEPPKKKKKEAKLKNFNLKDVLIVHPIGKVLLPLGAANVALQTVWQSLLCDVIIVYCLTHYTVLLNEDLDVLAEKIVELFPSECKQTYYVPPIKLNDSKHKKSELAKGKLVDKYRNTCTIIRTLEKAIKTPAGLDENTIFVTERLRDPAIISKTWLLDNREEKDVINHWNISYPVRKDDVASNKYLTATDVFNDWPILKEAISCQLVHLDFIRNYPDKESNLITRWDDSFRKVVHIYYDKLSPENKQRLDLLKLSDEIITPISKHAIQTELLAILLAPKSNKAALTNSGNKRKSLWKPKIEEAQNGIFLHVTVPGDIQKAVDDRVVKASKKKSSVQPYLIVVGQDNLRIKKVYIQIDTFRYEQETFLKGLDTLMKFFLTFNLAYPLESENIWYFIQWEIYNITTKSDTHIPFIYHTMNLLKKLNLPKNNNI